MVDTFVREARLKLIRLQVINAGLEVKQPSKKKGWGMEQNDAMWDEGDIAAGGFGTQTGPIGAGGRDITGSAFSQRKGG